MRIARKYLRDCLQNNDSTTGSVDLQCGFTCERCGFYKPVAKQRQKRIQNNDFSVREDGIKYLKIKKGEVDNAEQSNPYGPSYARPRIAHNTIGRGGLLIRHSR